MGLFLTSVYSYVGLDLFITVVGYFMSCTRNMMPSVFWNSRSTYCFGFFLNFFNCSSASLWLTMVPKTVPKSSTSTLKFLIYDVCDIFLKCMLCLPCDDRPLLHKIFGLIIGLRCCYLICSLCLGLECFLRYHPRHCLPRLVGLFLFPGSSVFLYFLSNQCWTCTLILVPHGT